MRSSVGRNRLLAGLCTALLIAACAPGDDLPPPDDPLPQPSDPTSSAEPAVTPTEPGPVSCGQIPREPTELEVSLLVEPGASSGDSFDAESAAAVVVAQAPATDEQWADAIIAQVQGDYADAVCGAIRFSGNLGDPDAQPTDSPPPDGEPEGRNHFALVLDASGSMEQMSGGRTRMQAAVKALTNFVNKLPPGATVSLRVYGHQGDNTDEGKAVSCASSEVIFEGMADDGSFGDTLATVQPVGWTPLARSISLVTNDIPANSTSAVVYVVTDGKETCDGDPVRAATELAGDGVQPIINVVGFEAGDADQAALAAIAEAGNGIYVPASSAGELTTFLDEEHARLAEAWRDWRRAERERLTAAVTEQREDVADIGSAIRETSEADLNHARSVIRVLERDGAMDEDSGRVIDGWIRPHFEDIGTYAENFEFDATRAIENNALRGDSETFVDAHDSWAELYRKRLEDDG